MRHKEKVALVTGATSGIGEATARRLADDGAIVILAGRREDKLAEILEGIQKTSPQSIAVTADLSVKNDVDRLFDTIKEKFGRLDLAINNAGVEGKVAAIQDCTLEDFDHIYGINVRGLFMCMQREVELMIEQKSGSIINVSSALGVVGTRHGTLYSGTKHAIMGMTKSLALEVARAGIKVNAVCPGVIDTPLFQRTNADKLDYISAMHPVGRIGTSQEVADLISWVGSSENSFMTGSAVMTDGGYTAM